MQKLKIMNAREKKTILKTITYQWGLEFGKELTFLYSERKHKLYVVTRDIQQLDLEKLHIDSLGMYFGELMKEESAKEGKLIRLSIEGSQLIGPHATKNVIEINEEDAQLWIRGNNIFNKVGAEGWVIVKNKKDFLGCGKVKEKVVLNYVSKARRIHAAE